MYHKPGDFIVHPAYGVGQIAAIEKMEFVEEHQRLFYRVGFGKTTIWVSVQAAAAGGIRPVTQPEALAHYRDVLESPPVDFDRNFQIRHNQLEERLRDSSFEILCEVVRDLNGLRAAKTLNNYEKKLYERSSRSLRQEWAIASGLPLDECARLIEAMLQKSSAR